MIQFLYRIQPTRADMLSKGPDAREAEIIGRHFDYLEDLVAQHIVLMAGRTLTEDENTFGVVVLEVDCETSARQIMENDPAVKEGVMNARLFPWRTALWSERAPSG